MVGLELWHITERAGHADAAARVEDAVAPSIAEGMTTPDLGGALTTEDAGSWIAERAVRAPVSGK